MTDLLVDLLKKLDAGAPARQANSLYSRGRQPLAFLSPESKQALNNRFGRVASNIPKLAVASLAERLRISAFEGADVWPDYVANDLDQLSGIAHREALTLGQSFVIVWGDDDGRPRATVESAEQVTVKRDPVSREVVAAVKRVRAEKTTEVWLYLTDEVQHHRANSSGATATAQFKLVDTVPNPLGVVPVVPVTNSERLADEDGVSEIEDLKPLVDGLCKTLADLAVAQEFTARPRRWATGIELTEKPVLDDDGNPVLEDGEPVMETVNPIPEGNRAMISENDQAKFGQLDGAKLDGYEAAVRIWLGQIQAVSALPAHFVGVLHDQPTSAESLRAAEASLTARAEARQLTFGRAWEQVARLMVAVRDGVNPADVSVQVKWADSSTRSVAAESDAAVKLFQAGILSRRATLSRLGFSEAEVERELGEVERDARVGADIRLGRFVSDLGDS